MTCREFDGVFSASSRGEPLPAAAAGHLGECARCSGLVRAVEAAGMGPTPSPSHLQHIRSMVLADLSPVRPLPPAATLAGALVLVCAAVIAAGTLIIGANGWHVMALTQKLAMYSSLIASAALLAVASAHQMAPGNRFARSPLMWFAGTFAAAVVTSLTLFEWRQEPEFVHDGLKCASVGLACAALTGVLLTLILRRGAVLDMRLTGATAGVLSGLAGLFLLEVHCPNPNGYHVFVWHIAVIPGLGALAGYWMGAAEERRQRRTRVQICP